MLEAKVEGGRTQNLAVLADVCELDRAPLAVAVLVLTDHSVRGNRQPKRPDGRKGARAGA